MVRQKNKEFVLVVPGLTRSQAVDLRDSLQGSVKKIAPFSHSRIEVGRKKNMESIIKRCSKQITTHE